MTPLPTSIEAIRAATNLQEEFPEIVKEKYEEFSLLYESRLSASDLSHRSSAVVVEYSQFPVNREVKKYSHIARAVFPHNEKQPEAENPVKLQESLARVLLERCFSDHILTYVSGLKTADLVSIASRSESTKRLYSLLIAKFDELSESRKVFAATTAFKKTKETILAGFAKTIEGLQSVAGCPPSS